MERFKNPKDLGEFVKNAEHAAQQSKYELSRRIGIDMCMYEGIQWLQSNMSMSGAFSVIRSQTNWNPDMSRLRVTMNETARLIQKAAAATSPDGIDAEWEPPYRDASPTSMLRAQAMETLLGAFVNDSGYVMVRRDANFRRCIAGTWGVGFHIRRKSRDIDMGDGPIRMEDAEIVAFDFNPTNLTLDVANQNTDLHRHEWVIYRDVWTQDKIEKTYGIKLDEKKLKTVGQLTPVEQQMAGLSQYRLFSRYQTYSTTKGAVVYQVMCKGDNGRFDWMYAGIGVPGDDFHWVNFDKPDNPFGGDGMPLMLLHGHRRADSMWSLSDVTMMHDDQLRLNLLGSLFFRQIQKNAGFQWLYDKRSAPKGKSEQDIASAMHNSVSGVIFYEGGTRDQNRPAPQLVSYPQPSINVHEIMEQMKSGMRDKVHRAEGNFGITKTHVPNSSFQRAIQESDQVFAIRVREDIARDERMMELLCGTAIRLAMDATPSVLATFRKNGMGVEEIGLISQVDPQELPGSVRIRESSVRHRSAQSKRDDLNMAAQMGVVDASEYRAAMASDLDSPVTQEDKFYTIKAQRAAQRLLLGESWTPIPMGKFGNVFISEFRRAMLDDRADSAARNRLSLAVIGQIELMASENATLAGPQQAPAETQQSGGEQPSGPQAADASISELMSAISAR